MTTNLDRASLVSRNVAIESVNLTHAEMRTGFDPFDPPEVAQLTQRFRCRFELPPSRLDCLFVQVNLILEGTGAENAEQEQELVSIDATFLAVYRLEDASSYPRDALGHFAELNGTYNVWPYWRELVQTFAARAGMGGLVVPVFKPPIRPVEEAEQVSPPEESALLESGNQ
ncbi:hypothetical protein [Candidatus Palauibacter sp.]|uniref:hypothetical protein n=1 Tax=Candidatus Palauibacter sp. TaxID=3101350 RepID=UPI003B0192F5